VSPAPDLLSALAEESRLREAAMAAAEPRTSVDHGAADGRVGAVLRTFMPHGRIETMPAARSKRLVVLDHVARVFEPGVRYPEPDVNAMSAGTRSEPGAGPRRCGV
jgi:hypothetical protein